MYKNPAKNTPRAVQERNACNPKVEELTGAK